MVSVTTGGGPGGHGAYRLLWRGAEIKGTITAATFAAMDETGEAAKAHAQAIVPVDTGRLRASIDFLVDQAGGDQRRRLTLFAGAPYARAVEEGTARQRAQPYLRPAIDAEAPRLTERIRAAIKGGG